MDPPCSQAGSTAPPTFVTTYQIIKGELTYARSTHHVGSNPGGPCIFTGSTSGQPVARRLLFKLHDSRRVQCTFFSHHGNWKYRTWLVFAVLECHRQLQHRS